MTGRFQSFLERGCLHRPEARAWALYDWANSAMVTVIITAVYPIYHQKVAAAGVDPDRSQAFYFYATAASLALVALLAVPLGALGDRRAWRKPLLGAAAGIGMVSTALLWFVGEGDWPLGLVLFGLANFGAGISFLFYDALLPHVAKPDEVDRLSTSGYALGYLGGGGVLALNLLWIQRPEWFGMEPGTLPSRLAFVSVALWWFVFSIPLFRRVPEPPPTGEPPGHGGRGVAAELLITLRGLRDYPQAFLLLIAFLIYNDGILTIIRVAAQYGSRQGISQGALISAILLVQFIGIPFAFLFGKLAGRIGAKRSVLFALAVYVFITVLAYFMTTATHFFALAILVGMVQGGAQALSRSMFASMIPARRSAAFFALFAIGEKFAGVAGPLVFAVITHATGSSQEGILFVVVFFAVGGALLMRVDVDEGRRAVLPTRPFSE